MAYGGGIAFLVVLALWLYCIFDVIGTDESLMRNLPKFAWLFIVIILPTIGSVAWLALGRPLGAGLRPGEGRQRASGPSPPRARPPVGPEDSPEFMAGFEDERRRLQQWEEELRRREDELRKRDQGEPEA